MSLTTWMDLRVDRMAAMFSRTPLAVDLPLLKGVSIPSSTMQSLQDAACNFLSASMSAYSSNKNARPLPWDLQKSRTDLEALPNRTPNGVVLPYLENVNAFARISDLTYSFVLSNDFVHKLSHLQVLPNLRLVSGRKLDGLADRPHATTKLHTDVWAGEPQFSVNILIPLLGDIAGASVRFFQPVTVPSELRCPLSSYGLENLDALNLIEYDVTLKHGVAYFFDAFLLHQTIYFQDGLRLSVDCRGLFKSHIIGEESLWKHRSRFMMCEKIVDGILAKDFIDGSFFDSPYHLPKDQ